MPRLTPEEAIARDQDYHRRHMAKLRENGLLALFYASNMAKGPCPRAAAYDEEAFDPEFAPIPPFDDCPHRDQCGCSYMAVMS